MKAEDLAKGLMKSPNAQVLTWLEDSGRYSEVEVKSILGGEPEVFVITPKEE